MIQSIQFWALLAVAVPVFWWLPSRLRLGSLATASLVYVASVDPVSTLWLAGWSVAFYFLAPLGSRKGGRARSVCSVLILGVLSVLVAYKYLAPLIAALFDDAPAAQLLVPLGISYYTFKLVHYAVEVGRGNITNPSFGTFACYLFLFPTFSAGPIERFDHFVENLEPTWRRDTAVEGLTRIAHGMVKKGFVVAVLLVPAYGSIDEPMRVARWLDTLEVHRAWYFVMLSFVISYLDFSAYSDIAIGCSRLFGIRIAENFNFPFLASDLTDFWRRWHMTLVGWLQSYVYMPLIGLTRNQYVAIFGTFVAIGLWHAGNLNWLLWGLFHATGVVAQSTWTRYRKRRKWAMFNTRVWKLLCTPLTFAYAGLGYVFVVMEEQGIVITLRLFARMLGVA